MIDLKAALDDVRQELATAHERHQALLSTIESLEAEAHGLQLAIARHNGHGAEAAAANGEASAWRKLARTDAILRILTESDKPMGPAQVAEALHKQGRNDRRDPVAAALAYLKTKGRVIHEDYGMWTVRRSTPVAFPSVNNGGDDH